VNADWWVNFKEYIHVPSNENFAIFLDNIEVSNVPSSIQIKNLMIKEVF
jgi:hypothetical protein